MNKIFLITKREYITRVRKKTFIIMSVLGPILFAAFLIVPIWLAQIEDKEEKLIAVIDGTGIFRDILPEDEFTRFDYIYDKSLDEMKNTLHNSEYYALLFIPENILYSEVAQIFSARQPSFSTRIYISNAIKNIIQDHKMIKLNIPVDILQSVKTNINITTIRLSEKGDEKQSSDALAMGVGYAGGFLIYFFIFLFGAQVMRGVMEEKNSRIIELIISSVKPFQLMMGKIIGIGLVGLTQFLLWVILTFTLVSVSQRIFFPDLSKSPTERVIAQDLMAPAQNPVQQVQPSQISDNKQVEEFFTALKDINYGVVLGSFLFFFLAGYLLYASLFAAIGAAADNETDTQQFMFPVTVPLIIAIFVMLSAINNPDGAIAFWFSLIPFTSPVVMMVRIPFGVPYWEVSLSMIILVLTFIGSTWMAGKIYRTGILMYGKKVNYKELWKWLRYSN